MADHTKALEAARRIKQRGLCDRDSAPFFHDAQETASALLSLAGEREWRAPHTFIVEPAGAWHRFNSTGVGGCGVIIERDGLQIAIPYPPVEKEK